MKDTRHEERRKEGNKDFPFIVGIGEISNINRPVISAVTFFSVFKKINLNYVYFITFLNNFILNGNFRVVIKFSQHIILKMVLL